MQSRYYDTVVGRFVNADDTSYLGTSGTMLAYNLYAYCENNAVNRIDPFGCYTTSLYLAPAVISALSSSLAGLMTSISASIAGIKAAIASSWLIPVCVAATAVAIAGIVYAVNKFKALSLAATTTISAVQSKVRGGGVKNPNGYSVYVIVKKNTVDVVYVGMTKNYTARKSQHTGAGKRFPTSTYTMFPIAIGLSKTQARALEQTIITAYGLDTLKNMINSISPNKWSYFISEFNQMTTLILSWLDQE